MTSLLTNSAAMVALATLSDINNNLSMTNNRVSTGLRIAQASDSAAYWAIATTTRTDNGALGTVQDALAIGKATLDVTYNGLESVRENIQEIKELLVAARQPGVNRGNIQTQIDGLLSDIENKARASVINEQNFLVQDRDDAAFSATRSVVASFERAAGGTVSVSTIDLDIGNIILIDDDGSDDGKTSLLEATGTGIPTVTVEDDPGATASTTGITVDGLFALRTYNDEDNDDTTFASPVGDLTDSAADMTTLDNMIAGVDAILTNVISAANTVGVNLARAESQETFISALMDANDRAVGAEMKEIGRAHV